MGLLHHFLFLLVEINWWLLCSVCLSRGQKESESEWKNPTWSCFKGSPYLFYQDPFVTWIRVHAQPNNATQWCWPQEEGRGQALDGWHSPLVTGREWSHSQFCISPKSEKSNYTMPPWKVALSWTVMARWKSNCPRAIESIDGELRHFAEREIGILTQSSSSLSPPILLSCPALFSRLG